MNKTVEMWINLLYDNLVSEITESKKERLKMVIGLIMEAIAGLLVRRMK
jgi:hypothetical protein